MTLTHKLYMHECVVSTDHAHQMEGGPQAIVAIPRAAKEGWAMHAHGPPRPEPTLYLHIAILNDVRRMKVVVALSSF